MLYVGTDIGVYRLSPDSGVAWEPFGTGLPPVVVNRLAYNSDDAAAAGGNVRPRRMGDLEPIPMRLRLALLAAPFVLQLACGGSSSPTLPSTTLNLGGTWAGSWQFVTSGVTVSDAVTATFTQTGATVSGTWRAESGASGQFAQLSPQTSTSGTVTICRRRSPAPCATALPP